MKKELRNKISEKVGYELNRKGFLLVDSLKKLIIHYKNTSIKTVGVFFFLYSFTT